MSKAKVTPLSTAYFREHPSNRGLVLDFTKSAAALSPDTGEDYVGAYDWRLGFRYEDESKSAAERRADIAEPRIIARYRPEKQSGLPDITSNGFDIKKPGDMHICLPDVFDFALPRISIAAKDALQLLGAEGFRNANLSFVIQRTDIEPGEFHRPHFTDWHDHRCNGENIDAVYLFGNRLGTDVKLFTHSGSDIRTTELSAPDGSVMRIGAEILHRSRQNTGEEILRREWGAVIVNIEMPKMGRGRPARSENSVYVGEDDPLFTRFKTAAERILKRDRSTQPLAEPQTLIDYVGLDCAH